MSLVQPRRARLARTSGIDHVTIGVRRHEAARAFYEHVLRPLGFRVRLSWPDGGLVCLGLHSEPSSVWLREGLPGPSHLSLVAGDRDAVDAFHAAALASGGSSAAPPALRPEHTAQTYAAEVLDPDGNRIEAICREPGAPAAAVDAA